MEIFFVVVLQTVNNDKIPNCHDTISPNIKGFHLNRNDIVEVHFDHVLPKVAQLLDLNSLIYWHLKKNKIKIIRYGKHF